MKNQGLRTFLRDPIGMLSLAIILLVLLALIFAPWLTSFVDQGLGVPGLNRLAPPSSTNIMGTDQLGRDMFARVLFGGRISVTVALLVVLLAVGIGLPLGMMAGFFGGWVDQVIMRATDVFLAFPPLLLAIFIAAILGNGFGNLILAIGLGWWPWYTRIARSQVVSLKTRPFVEAAVFMGVSPLRIMQRHLLPFVTGPVVVQATLDIGAIILTAAALSFLGLGVAPPTPDWGQIISEGRAHFPTRWWYVAFPGLAIVILAVAFNLLGDSLRAAMGVERRS